MKYRNSLALIAALLLFGAGNLASAQTQSDSPNPPASGAQDQGGPGSRGFGRPRLNLTADQKTKLKALHESERQQIEAVRNDASLSLDQKRAKFRSIGETMRPQFQAVLTPEQQQLLQSGRQGPRGSGGFAARGDRFAALGLTTDQRSQIESIHKSTQQQVSAIRGDTTLTSEQKEEKLKSLFQNSQQQVTGVLTPEQQQKFREARQGGPRGFGRGHHRDPNASDAPATPPPAQP